MAENENNDIPEVPWSQPEVADQNLDQPKEQEINRTTTEIKEETDPLKLAIWSDIKLLEDYVNGKRDELDKQKIAADTKHETTWAALQTEIQELLRTNNRAWLLSKASQVIDYFFWWLFWKKGDPAYTPDALFSRIKDLQVPQEVDFKTMDKEQLQKYITQLTWKISQESHMFKRLHYIWLMSRAKDALWEIEWKKPQTQYERLSANLKNGDLILLGNNGDYWNGMLTKKSASPIAHIGVYYEGKFCQSTMNGNLLNPTWGESIDFKDYLNKSKPRWCMIMRTTSGEQAGQKIWKNAQNLIDTGQIQYDQLGALADTWFDITGNKHWQANKYNCGEFVGKVIEEVTWQDVPDDKDALPGTYATLPWFTPIYMDWYTGELPKNKA